MVDVTSPQSKWGPALEENRGERYKRPTDIGMPYTISSTKIDKQNVEFEMDNMGYTKDGDEIHEENGTIPRENGMRQRENSTILADDWSN